MKRNLAYLIAITLLTFSCGTPKGQVEKTPSGIIVHPDEGVAVRVIKLEPVTNDIIHVTASPVDSFSNEQSLMIVPELKPNVSWEVLEAEEEVTIQTPRLKATVSLKTGEVTFKDSLGNVILQEQKGGGKTFQQITLDNYHSYSIRQVFESPADEAFYGLGAHQNRQMNYKGEDVEMVQHNIVDVVPFLYSSKNYGILWDNYSISKFGDPRDYQPLNTLTLFDKNGVQGGLTADYYVKEKIVRTATEDKIKFEYLETPQVDTFPKNVAQQGKVVWEGSFTSDTEGRHKFLVYASGYFKVWIDNELIMDKWRQGWNPWNNKFNVDITKGEKHNIKIEWTPDYGAYLAVKHLDPLSPEEQNRLSLFSEVGNNIDYYFIKGDNADEVIHGYRVLTGKAPIVPKWAMGFWQSRERYRSQNELIDVVKEYRKRKIPLDNIVLDWQYWEDPKWGSHEFDVTRFPNPKGMLDEIHNDLGAHLMISVWPKFNKGTENYDAMNEKGFLFKRNAEMGRKDWVGIGYESTFYDPFNEDAGKLFWKQIDERLNLLGIDGWWLDATEPDMHSNLSIEERKKNMDPTALGPGAKYFNAYSLMNSKSVYEGQRASSPDKRVFILTRSAYAGQQRFGAVTWSGDIVSRWSDFKDQIAAGVNFSLSGIPYWTMDIGGFAVERRYEKATGETLNEWRELNTRWFQFGTFCPVFRSHGQYPVREIFNLTQPGSVEYNSMVYYDKLRYRLMPYVYSLAGHAYFNDYTIMRGLVMDFNNDQKVHTIADQYMFGPSLLVNPVTDYKARSRKVYLPATSDWYDFYTGKFIKGGQTITADARLDRIPLYVKAGSIIPAGPEIQYTTEKPTDPVTLYVFTGSDASFSLYEDEDVNYNYEQGKYAMTPFNYDEAKHTLTVGKRTGAFPGMLEKRTFQIVWVNDSRAVGVELSSKPQQVIEYSGEPLTVSME